MVREGHCTSDTVEDRDLPDKECSRVMWDVFERKMDSFIVPEVAVAHGLRWVFVCVPEVNPTKHLTSCQTLRVCTNNTFTHLFLRVYVTSCMLLPAILFLYSPVVSRFSPVQMGKQHQSSPRSTGQLFVVVEGERGSARGLARNRGIETIDLPLRREVLGTRRKAYQFFHHRPRC